MKSKEDFDKMMGKANKALEVDDFSGITMYLFGFRDALAWAQRD